MSTHRAAGMNSSRHPAEPALATFAELSVADWRREFRRLQRQPQSVADVMTAGQWALGNLHLDPRQTDAPTPLAWGLYCWAMTWPDSFFRSFVPRFLDYLAKRDRKPRSRRERI